MDIMDRAARYVERRSKGYYRRDDARQEGELMLRAGGRFARKYEESLPSDAVKLGRALFEALYAKDRASSDVLDRLPEQGDIARSWVDSFELPGYAGDQLKEALVLHYVPSLLALSERGEVEDAPTSGRGDPTTKNTAWAVLADVNVAFARAKLTRVEEQAIFCLFVLNESISEAGRRLQRDRKTVMENAQRGIDKLSRALMKEEND